MKRWLVSALIAAVMMAVIVYGIMHTYHFDFKSLLAFAPRYFLLLLAIASLDIGLRGLRILLVSRQVGAPVGWRQGMRIALAADFFAAITPSRIGGEPARLVGLMRAHLSAAKALLVLGIEALMDLGYLLLALPFFLYFSQGQESHLVNLVRGLIATALMLLGLPVIFLFMKEKWVRSCFALLQNNLPGLYHLLSGFGRWRLEEVIAELRRNLVQVLRGPWWYFPIGCLLTCSWWLIRFSALYWIAQGLSFSIPVADVFWPQFLIYNSMIFTPLPVSGGLFETSFILLYTSIIPENFMSICLVLWRFFTFYLFVISGAVVSTRSMWRLTLRKLERPQTLSYPLSSLNKSYSDTQ